MPNFWGCRCCKNNRLIRIRAVDPGGTQLWVWNKFPINYEVIRPLSFSVSSFGCLICEKEGELQQRISQVSLAGVAEWTVDLYGVVPLLVGSISGTLPVHDSTGNIYLFLSGLDSLGTLHNYLISFDQDGVYRWIYDTGGLHIFNIAASQIAVWFYASTNANGAIYGIDFDGTLNGTRPIGFSANRHIAGGEMRINSDGNLFYVERDAAGSASLVVLDANCGLVLTSTVTNTEFTGTVSASLGLQADGSMAGLGVNSLGSPVLKNLETDTSVIEFDPLASQRSSDFDNAGNIYANEVTSIYDRVIKYNEIGTKLWTLTETTGDRHNSNLYIAPQIACFGDLILIGTSLERRNAGFTVT